MDQLFFYRVFDKFLSLKDHSLKEFDDVATLTDFVSKFCNVEKKNVDEWLTAIDQDSHMASKAKNTWNLFSERTQKLFIYLWLQELTMNENPWKNKMTKISWMIRWFTDDEVVKILNRFTEEENFHYLYFKMKFDSTFLNK